MKPSSDDLMIHRYLDEQLPPGDAARFAARLLEESGLRARVDEARSLRRGFAAARGRTFAPPPGFTAAVVAAARRLPVRHDLEQADLADSAARFCRLLLFAAALAAGLGLAWHTGLFRADSGVLQAAPDEVQREIDRLDALVRGR